MNKLATIAAAVAGVGVIVITVLQAHAPDVPLRTPEPIKVGVALRFEEAQIEVRVPTVDQDGEFLVTLSSMVDLADPNVPKNVRERLIDAAKLVIRMQGKIE